MLKEQLQENGYTAIALEQSAIGHFHVKIKIDHMYTTFIVDTGAASTVIDKSFATENNISMIETALVGGGVGTSQLKIFKAEVKQFYIDGYEVENINLYSVDLEHVKTSLSVKGETNLPQGVLGADILIAKKAIIDYNARLLFLN